MRMRFLVITLLSLALLGCGGSDKRGDKAKQTEIETASAQIVNEGSGWNPSHIVISKETMMLTLYDKHGKIIYNFPISVGKEFGNKADNHDMKTPEGEFTIHHIADASMWSHDFKDGKGVVAHAYGDWFIRLKTPPYSGIGICGTHDPNIIGTRGSDGNIRLHNENLNQLRPLVKVGMKVTIETSMRDLKADGRSTEEYTAKAVEKAAEKSEAKSEEKREESKTEKREEESKLPPSLQTQPVATPGGIIEHTITSGDTFGGLAVKYNTTTAKIQELNPDINPGRLQLGQRVRIQPNTYVEPKQQAVANEDPNGVYHTIASGEYLSHIAVKYDTTVAKIQELNPNIDPLKIRVGQRIRVK